MRYVLKTFVICLGLANAAAGQIPKPDDAPQPLSPDAAAALFRLPSGMHMELVASEPLIQEPSGVCWDERGRLFVCELHGYNLDGQIDINEVNKTGKLDRVVRRFFVPEHIEAAAKKGTYGTVKLLIDSDGDGRMDKSEIWADRLPPCFGICPARGGIVVVSAPDIVFLADHDGDGVAEVQEVLYSGFSAGILERRMGTPQWGLDDWIYVGRPHRGTTVSGPHLLKPVMLPDTDFRIKSDGSAIEPISGAVGGLGHTFTADGDRFVSSIGWPAHFVAPLPWHSLARNPFVATPALTVQVFPDRRVYPTSKPHPWRVKRADDPGFSRFYTDGYGIAESAPNGYFTSCCGPLVYQDSELPGLQGNLLACEPAQNLVHRSAIERDGAQLNLRRAKGEEKSEFLTTVDSWFHPIALSHGPDGGIWIVDFYREIIEDYSAIPRYLQQQYGVTNGNDRGRIWRIVNDAASIAKPYDMSQLGIENLAMEVGSPRLWRRQTARRLLIERKAIQATATVARITATPDSTDAVINALHTLAGLGTLTSDVLEVQLGSTDAGIRRLALRLSEARLDAEPALLEAALRLSDDAAPHVRLQLALSLGASHDRRVFPILTRFARQNGNDLWMRTAILSSLSGRCGEMLNALLANPADLGQATAIVEPLCSTIGAQRQVHELSDAIIGIAAVKDGTLQATCLRGIKAGFSSSIETRISDDARSALARLASDNETDVRAAAVSLVRMMRIESTAEREARLNRSMALLNDATVTTEIRLDAVAELTAEDDAGIAEALIDGLQSATPRLSEAILNSVFSRRDRIPALIDALEQKLVPMGALSAVQRSLLLEDKDESVRTKAGRIFPILSDSSLDAFPKYAAALKEPRDVAHGQKAFREICGKCHQAHGTGVAVGPDLSSEFQRAEETVIKDILAPNTTISPGYMTYIVTTRGGQTIAGLLASESPTSITLKQPEGKQQVVLRNDVDELKASAVSMMPEDLVKTVTPRDAADIIAWLRQPQQQMVLLDDNRNLATALNEGSGTAEFITTDKYSGESSLRITPPQRFSPQITGWDFRIREQPVVGEYRYLRFAWKAPQAAGIMLELADRGQWPPADQPLRRYFAGKNLTAWQAVGVATHPPANWTVVTRDLWKDFGEFTLTGFAPTAIGGPALFDRIELLRSLETP